MLRERALPEARSEVEAGSDDEEDPSVYIVDLNWTLLITGVGLTVWGMALVDNVNRMDYNRKDMQARSPHNRLVGHDEYHESNATIFLAGAILCFIATIVLTARNAGSWAQRLSRKAPAPPVSSALQLPLRLLYVGVIILAVGSIGYLLEMRDRIGIDAAFESIFTFYWLLTVGGLLIGLVWRLSLDTYKQVLHHGDQPPGRVDSDLDRMKKA